MPTTTADNSTPLARRRWLIKGQVQGVGFRPFVYREARALGLGGVVRNDGDSVVIEAQGTEAALAKFAARLTASAPPLARIDSIDDAPLPPKTDAGEFIIETSRAIDQPTDSVTVDTAVCNACSGELRAAADRRHGYALINCTNCGPRYSIVRDVPYDRPSTTMAGFEMCQRCRAEYTDPADRRFHAQPIACHDCGPTLQWVDPTGQPLAGDPIAEAAGCLRRGRIVLIKGLGGFHLASLANDEAAVARLRQLKHRDAKPFAVMLRSIESARRYVELSDPAAELMQGPRCPIVIAPRLTDTDIAPSVAPGIHRLGVMLPYTPIQHLLLDALGDVPLVMTSANVSDEPLVTDNEHAVERLGNMCDGILWHDRPIERAVDDSVLLDAGAGRPPVPIRRARGYVPEPIPLPVACDQTGLCVGGELKNTVAVVRDGRAILSHHLGDLKHPLALANFTSAIDDLCRLFGVEPKWIAHDLHPAYLSTRHAQSLARQLDVPLIAVQHHHAHATSLMAEHNVTGPMLALTCDGVGHGDDGTSWGGELLLATLSGYQRVARLMPLDLPGGDAAARDTRRCALALLHQAYGGAAVELPIARRMFNDDERQMLGAMLRRGVNTAPSSALGRYFDGAAALIGLCRHNSFEAQAAMELEAAAASVQTVVGTAGSPGFGVARLDLPTGSIDEIDLSETTRRIVEGVMCNVPVGELAAWFHDEVARAVARGAIAAANTHGVDTVGLTGGCFVNQRLTGRVTELLRQHDLRVLQHHVAPAGDGGIALGQAAAACAQIQGVSSCV